MAKFKKLFGEPNESIVVLSEAVKFENGMAENMSDEQAEVLRTVPGYVELEDDSEEEEARLKAEEEKESSEADKDEEEDDEDSSTTEPSAPSKVTPGRKATPRRR